MLPMNPDRKLIDPFGAWRWRLGTRCSGPEQQPRCLLGLNHFVLATRRAFKLAASLHIEPRRAAAEAGRKI